MQLLKWLSLALTFSLAWSAEMVELHSPRVTNYGDWNGWVKCDGGTYAAGIQIKAEGKQGRGDDTGLNAVALYCLPFNWNSIVKTSIMSGQGGWGDWQAIKWCPRGQVIVGFQLRSEPQQEGDDVAADNFAAFCGSPFSAPDHSNYLMGDTPGWGEWTAKQFCPQSYAVCAINSQVEGEQGGGDDTALNNVDLRCCEVDYSCKPDAELVTADSFDNREGFGEMQYDYTVRTSFTKMTSNSETLSTQEKKMIANKISSELGTSYSGLTAKLTSELGITLENGSTRSLQSMVQETSEHSTEKKISVPIPMGKRAVLKQLHFTCGDYRIAVAKTIFQEL